MTDPSSAPGAWAIRPVPPQPRSIVAVLADGILDATLAATLSLLVERRVPLIVAAGEPGLGASSLLDALLAFLPPDVARHDLDGSNESFDWLPQASELGWPGKARIPDREPVRPDTTMLVAAALSDSLPAYTWGERARIAVRATAIGYGLAATIRADSLDEVLEELGAQPVALGEDELSFLGCVVVLRRIEAGRRRVGVAHYLRPTVRDAHGHTQRLGPAVLSTWDPISDIFEDFSWGITPELAFRIGVRPGDFELEVQRRREWLESLVATGVTGVAEVSAAIERYRAASAFGGSEPPGSH